MDPKNELDMFSLFKTLMTIILLFFLSQLPIT